MTRKLKQPHSHTSPGANLAPSDAIQLTPAGSLAAVKATPTGSAAVVNATPTRPGGKKRTADPATVELAVVELAAVEPAAVVLKSTAVSQVVTQAMTQSAMTLDPIDMPEAEMNTVTVGMTAMPPMPPGLATLTDEINSATCDFGRLGKATIQAALILGQLLLDLVQYVPQAQWSEWVRAHTPLTIPNAEAFVTVVTDHEHLAARVTPIVAMTTTQILEALVGLGDAYKEAAGESLDDPASSSGAFGRRSLT